MSFSQSSHPDVNVGPVIRIAPNLLSLSEPALLPTVYHAHADKTPFYSPFIAGGEPALLQIREDKSHAGKLKTLNPTVNNVGWQRLAHELTLDSIFSGPFETSRTESRRRHREK